MFKWEPYNGSIESDTGFLSKNIEKTLKNINKVNRIYIYIHTHTCICTYMYNIFNNNSGHNLENGLRGRKMSNKENVEQNKYRE